jgi:hypothetical protein
MFRPFHSLFRSYLAQWERRTKTSIVVLIAHGCPQAFRKSHTNQRTLRLGKLAELAEMAYKKYNAPTNCKGTGTSFKKNRQLTRFRDRNSGPPPTASTSKRRVAVDASGNLDVRLPIILISGMTSVETMMKICLMTRRRATLR